MLANTLDAQRDIAVNALRNGGRVLIVGARPDNLPPDLRDHPRVVLYHSTDNKQHDHRPIPPNVRLVLFTRFLAHETHRWYRRQASAKGIHCFNVLMATGQIRSILDALRPNPLPPEFDLHPDDAAPETDAAMPFNPVINPIDMGNVPLHVEHQPDPPPRPSLVPPGMIRSAGGKLYTIPAGKRGALQVFLPEFFLHYPALKGNGNREAARVAITEAASIGIPSTINSLAQAIAVLLKRQAATGAKVKAVPVPPPVPAPAPAAPLPPVPLNMDHPAVADMLKLIDEAMTNLQLLREQVLIDLSRMQTLIRREAQDRLVKMQELLSREG